ncbi:hypothetical protein NIES4101_46380 [Calothrix sp. NIES-4101]|nr:hypothetical protein NIES4101_46380 [Calothrix sp. NIES-4101]
MTLIQEMPVNSPLPVLQETTATWGKILLPDNTSKIISLQLSKNNSLVLTLKNRIWQYRDNTTWEIIASSPNSGSISQYLIGDTVTYVIVNSLAYEMKLGTSGWKAIPNSSFVDLAVVDGDTLWGINEAGYLHQYTPGNNWIKAEIAPLKLWKSSQSVGIAAKGNNFWFGLRFRAKQLFEQDKNPIARETVWQLQKENQSEAQLYRQIDITENINLLNLSGKPFGPFGQLCTTPDGILYASTEQGVWQRSLNNLDNNSGWQQLRSHAGKILLFPLSNSSLLTYNPRSQELLWWNNQIWHSIPTPPHEISSAVLVGDILYITGNNTLSVISIKTAKSMEPPQPRMATYLNLGKLSTAIYCQNQLFVTNENTLFQIAANNPKPISAIPLTTPAFDISHSSDKTYQNSENIFIATQGELLKYSISENILKTVFINPTPPQKARVDSDRDFTAYLTDKTIRVFDNSNHNLVTQITISADYVEDIAIKNNKLYVVGYNNQRNTQKKQPVQSAFLRCFQITNTLTQLWQTWGFSGNELGNDMADTRMYRVVANDSEVAVLGESAGGNTAYRWNGKDLSTSTLVTYDMFNDAFDAKSAHFSYYAIVDASTGTVKRGQFSIPRLLPSSSRSNTNRTRSLAFDENNLYIGTFSSFQISNRDFVKFLGQKPPIYKDGDAALLKVPNDLKVRDFWFTPGNGQVLFFDSNCTVINVAANTPQNPLLNGIGRVNQEDTYVIIW